MLFKIKQNRIQLENINLDLFIFISSIIMVSITEYQYIFYTAHKTSIKADKSETTGENIRTEPTDKEIRTRTQN